MIELGGGSLLSQMEALVHDWDGSTERRYCHLANASALLCEHLERVIWVGFYLTVPGTERLVLGPFQGKVACTDISFTRGVCGLAARTKQSVRIADVHQIPDHIACDSASQSELVIPLFSPSHDVVGVLDIDSAEVGRFTEEDQRDMEAVAALLSHRLWT
ncbi:MAG: GAF domain-containing protein [Sphaerochaeta sp.]|jgi:GAF domain-containing protein|uniref:GAF domain-containing protein n=1 Tax=Sphaerochaeta sp. TaxID=1972642 RepID=UPI003D099DD5